MGRNYCLWANCFFDEIPETKFLTDRVSRTDSKPITQCMRALRQARSKACWQGSIVCLCYPFCLSAFPFLFCFVSLLVVVFCCFSCLSVFNVCRLSLSKFSNLSFHFVVSLCRFVVVLSFRRSLCRRVVVLPMHCTTNRRTI